MSKLVPPRNRGSGKSAAVCQFAAQRTEGPQDTVAAAARSLRYAQLEASLRSLAALLGVSIDPRVRCLAAAMGRCVRDTPSRRDVAWYETRRSGHDG